MRSVISIIAVAAFLGGLSPAAAAEPGQWNFELYAGWYLAGDLEDISEVCRDEDCLDAIGIEPADDLTWGIRGGKRQAEKWGWQLGLGVFDTDDSFEGLEGRNDLSLEAFFFDVSFLYYVGQSGNFFFYGGPGLAILDLDIRANSVPPPLTNLEVDESEESISIHGGLGYNFDVGERMFIRLDGRLRYVDADFYSGETDGELTVAIGWNFGG
jgi:hypothetical protein